MKWGIYIQSNKRVGRYVIKNNTHTHIEHDEKSLQKYISRHIIDRIGMITEK
jgi:hypothetical protein